MSKEDMQMEERKTATIQERVMKVIQEQLGADLDNIKEDARFIEDLGADSLDTVEMVMAFEEAFDCEIPDEEAQKMRTVADAVQYLEKHARK